MIAVVTVAHRGRFRRSHTEWLRRRHDIRGFTMTELAVTMAIGAILLAVAVPSFSSLMASQRGKTYASDLFAALLKTRSASLALNRTVTIAANQGDWKNGWQILDPNNPALALDNRGAAAGITVTGPYVSVAYNSAGRLATGLSPVPSFVIATQSGGTTLYQCVSIDISGRPYTRSGSTC